MYILLLLYVWYIDEFILDAVLNTNDIVSDTDASDTAAHTRPFGESSYSAIMSKGTTIGMHNAYIAMGTFASAIFIVAIVVSCCFVHFFSLVFGLHFVYYFFLSCFAAMFRSYCNFQVVFDHIHIFMPCV